VRDKSKPIDSKFISSSNHIDDNPFLRKKDRKKERERERKREKYV